MAFDPNDKETKEALEAAAAEAVAGLKAKNTELLGKLKKAQKDATIDPADHAELQAQLDATEIKLAEATKALKVATAEVEKHQGAFEAETKLTRSLLVGDGLSKELLANGVKNPVYIEAAKALLEKQVALSEEDGNRVAKVGDKILKDFIKDWAASDAGKSFVDAPSNSGGDALGGSGSTDGVDLAAMKPEARLNTINANASSTN